VRFFFLFLLLGCSVCIEDACFDVDVASDDSSRQQGLMELDSMPDDYGMLFVFEEGIHPFWMKNTRIPLDIIWINDGKVVAIEKASPCYSDPCAVYDPGVNSTHVLEINQNLTDRYDIKVGSIIGKTQPQWLLS